MNIENMLVVKRIPNIDAGFDADYFVFLDKESAETFFKNEVADNQWFVRIELRKAVLGKYGNIEGGEILKVGTWYDSDYAKC